MGLETYRKKRKFDVTSEPRGRVQRAVGHRYVIQKHDATRLHYDLRLELDGVMKSWAVTRGPSLDPNDKRLAVHVEDHPIEYNTFEGIIPEAEYGGGTVMIWDRGTWAPDGDPHKGYAKGHIEFTLHGKKLRGRWHLVRMRPRPGDRRDSGHDNWLLIKAKDEEARSGRNADILEAESLSAATGRSMEEIAAGKGRKRVWHSNRSRGGAPLDPPKESGRPQSQRDFKAQLKALAATRAKPGRKAAAQTGATQRPAAKQHARTKSAAAKVERKSAQGPRRNKEGSGAARLPKFVPPSLATLHERAPSGNNWLHEIKFDGYRIEARLDHGKVQLLTRKQQDWTHRFPSIAEAVKALPAETALIDGELVVEDDKGISNFSLLQSALKEGDSDRFVYRAFDLLYLDGKDLTGEPLTARKAALHRLLKGESRTGRIRYVEHFDEDGPVIFKSAGEMHLEGIVSKLRDAPYRSGRSDNFIKVKCHNEQELVVAGFSPSAASPKAVGALIAAFHEHGELRYAGRIGTGYTRDVARDLWRRLYPLRIDKPPVKLPADERRKDVVWVRPRMVIEAEFRGITHDGLMRQASFKGLREDKPADEVVRETSATAGFAAMAQRRPVRKSAKSSSEPERTSANAEASNNKKGGEIAGARLTHPDRVYWADAGVTKEDLANYYVRVWDCMAPHVVGRPLAVLRCPQGTAGECFFQKHIAQNIRQSSLRHVVKGKDHDVIAVETLEELIELVQSGALEIHVRGSRLDSLETCDRIVFDLDPGEGVAWKEVVAGAKEIRDRLAALKLKCFAKLSGGKGIHVVVPIADADWDTAKAFSATIAEAMAADSPKLYLAKMTKALREGRIFIDYLRNTREATSVAVYSTRARAGAPVSMPVSWEALARTRSGHQFTLPDLKKAPAKDAWAELGKVRQKLPEIANKRR